MGDSFIKLGSIALPTSFGALLTVPSLTQYIVKQMRLSNSSTSSASQATLWHGTQTNANLLTPISGVTFQPGEFAIDDGTITMAAGDVINGVQTVSGVIVVTFYGDAIT